MDEATVKSAMIPTPWTPRADGGLEEKRPPAPPRTLRRVREVSSRYMAAVTSPCAASSSSGAAFNFPPHPPKKLPPLQKHHHALFPSPSPAEMSRVPRSPSSPMRQQLVPSSSNRRDSDSESSCYGDENHFQLGNRSSTTPSLSGFQRGKLAVSQNRRVMRLFRENGGEQSENPKIANAPLTSRATGSRFVVMKTPKGGTPIVHPLKRDAAMSVTPRPSAYGQNLAISPSRRPASRRGSSQVNRSLQESLKGANQRSETPSSDYDANSCRSGGTSPEKSTTAELSEADACSVSSPGGLGFCDSPIIHGQSNRSRLSSECRSSMPESLRLSTEGKPSHADSSSHRGSSSSLCSRSLNSALSGCQPPQLHRTSSVCKLPRDHLNSARAETATKKGRKMLPRQEDAHTLRILQNRVLQWRFLNAKAQATAEARGIVAERSLLALSAHLPGLRDSVATKKIELNQLQKMTNVSELVAAQMPLLSEWASLEDEHAASLSGAVKSLQDTALRLPVSSNVKVDVKEIGETLSSASDALESLVARVGCLLLKVDGMQNVASDLAEVVCEERALVEECGDLLAEAQALQVKECSLRTHLIQQRRAVEA